MKIDKFSSLLDTYDYFLVDIHGVVHDGVNGFASAIDCLNIMSKTKPVIFVSNNPRPRSFLYNHLLSLGISYDVKVHSSGDLVLDLLDNQYADHRIFHLGQESNHDLFKNREENLVSSIEEANLVVLSLNVSNKEKLSSFEPVFQEIVKKSLKVICANPDKTTPHGNTMRICAGTTASLLEEKGVSVLYAGKPEKILYEYILAKESAIKGKKGLMIGDTLETDVLFAHKTGLDSLLVLSGVTGASFSPLSGLQPTYFSPILTYK